MPKRVSKDYINDVENFNELPIYSQRIRYYLDEHSLTAKELNEKAGFSSPNVVPSLIKGSRELSLDAAKKLCAVMSVSIDYLVGRSNAATADEKISAICAYTGLSSKAVEILHTSASADDRLEACFKNEIVTSLIESRSMESLCICIKDYFIKSELAQEASDDALKGLLPKTDVYIAEKAARYAQYEAVEQLKSLMDETQRIPSMYAFEMMWQIAKSKEVPNGEHNETQK